MRHTENIKRIPYAKKKNKKKSTHFVFCSGNSVVDKNCIFSPISSSNPLLSPDGVVVYVASITTTKKYYFCIQTQRDVRWRGDPN